MPTPIYLDNNSTTPILPEVVEAMVRAFQDLSGNPASQHSLGRKTRRVLEETREGIVSLLGGKTGGIENDKLIFTSGGTEANQLAIRGLVEWKVQGAECGAPVSKRKSEISALKPELQKQRPGVVISAIEHPSVMGAAEALFREGFEVRRLPVGENGMVDAARLPQFVDERTELVSVMLANNETGVIQPVAVIARSCAALKIPVHTDAVQAVGKTPVYFRNLGVSAMTVAPHKFHGPVGIGGLLVRHGTLLEPLLYGGFQQGGLRPGTESVALAIGFYIALVVANRELAERERRMAEIRERLEKLLLAGAPGAVLIGASSPRLPTTTCIAFPGLNRQALVMALDMAGVACSTGSACASGSSEPSATLIAMGLSKDLVESAIRLSLGALSTAAEAEDAAGRILKCVNHLRRG